MSTLKINETIPYLRKQKGVTQEELAQSLHVSNQAVSKWESGICCPDLSLLPKIADYFHTSVDRLLGHSLESSTYDIALQIKDLFKQTKEEDCIDLAYKLAFLAAEGAQTKGGKQNVPWNTDKLRLQDDSCYQWGYSACHEPEGTTVINGNTVLLSSQKEPFHFSSTDLRSIHNNLLWVTNKDALNLFFTLYKHHAFGTGIGLSPEQLARLCGLPLSTVEETLENLPLIQGTDEGYLIDGPYACFVPLLMLLVIK